VQVQDRQRRFKVFGRSVESFCSGLLQKLGKTDWALSVVFVGPKAMQTINQAYRGRDYPTDVLSFHYPGETVDGIPFLGEIIVAPEIAWARARSSAGGGEQEVRKLLVHGILHLMGYDHETDQGEMNRLQARIIRSTVFRDAPPLASLRNAS
jgi:probable rRNA maturation factor